MLIDGLMILYTASKMSCRMLNGAHQSRTIRSWYYGIPTALNFKSTFTRFLNTGQFICPQLSHPCHLHQNKNDDIVYAVG